MYLLFQDIDKNASPYAIAPQCPYMKSDICHGKITECLETRVQDYFFELGEIKNIYNLKVTLVEF